MHYLLLGLTFLFHASIAFAGSDEDLEPFVVQAKEKLAEENYTEALTLCRGLAVHVPKHPEVKKCIKLAKKKVEEERRAQYIDPARTVPQFP